MHPVEMHNAPIHLKVQGRFKDITPAEHLLPHISVMFNVHHVNNASVE